MQLGSWWAFSVTKQMRFMCFAYLGGAVLARRGDSPRFRRPITGGQAVELRDRQGAGLVAVGGRSSKPAFMQPPLHRQKSQELSYLHSMSSMFADGENHDIKRTRADGDIQMSGYMH